MTDQRTVLVSMDDDFSLFDPLQPIDSSTKIIKPENSSETVVRSEEKSVDKTVILEDLLGGFSEEIKVDAVDGGDNDADRMRSTTSFFLLDLDNNEGGAERSALTDVTQSDHRAGIGDVIEEDDHDDIIDDHLSVTGDTLPLDQERGKFCKNF